jgi:hypothetical protein
MHIYYTGASPDNLRRAREHAPSHTHGMGWTPAKMTPHDVPYFVDNGAYTADFEMAAWLETLEAAKTEMPRLPDFVVWPDVYGDAGATIERCRRLFRRDASLKPRHASFDRYVVFQPGRPIDELFDWADEMDADGVFVGGSATWKRAFGAEIARRAHNRGLHAHVGRPSGADGLEWAYRAGFDSADTTTIFQNGYWHYLDALEAVTKETGTTAPDHDQVRLCEVEQ